MSLFNDMANLNRPANPMNEVKLTDFDKQTLSEMAELVNELYEGLTNARELTSSEGSFNKLEGKISRALTFRTQLLYAFQIVNDRQKILNQ